MLLHCEKKNERQTNKRTQQTNYDRMIAVGGLCCDLCVEIQVVAILQSILYQSRLNKALTDQHP